METKGAGQFRMIRPTLSKIKPRILVHGIVLHTSDYVTGFDL